MRVHWTRRALRRIDQHIAFIAQWSPSAGYQMGQRVRQAVENLIDHPLLGREGRYIGTRELVVEGGRYIAVYSDTGPGRANRDCPRRPAGMARRLEESLTRYLSY